MGLLSMNAEQLRYKMKHLDELCPNRSVTNDDELLDEDELIGGLSVANRVESIQEKIYKVLVKSTNNGEK